MWCLPAALGDGLINGFVNLLIVVVLVSGVFPHVGLQRRGMTAHIAAQGAPGREERKYGEEKMNDRVKADQAEDGLI